MILGVKYGVCAAALLGIALSGATTHASALPLSESEAKTYSSAIADAARGNWQTAHRRAAGIRQELPAKILHWLELSAQGNRYSFETISEFVLKNDNWPLRGTLRRRAEEALGSASPSKATLRWFDTYPPLTTDGKIRQIEALIALGD